MRADPSLASRTAPRPPASGSPASPISGAAPTERKKPPWKPWGATWAKKLGFVNLLTLVAALYGVGEYMSRPLHHLRGAEVAVDVLRVIDGDSFVATVYPDRLTARFRLRHVDAPEMAQPFGVEAKEALEGVLMGGAGGGGPDDTAAAAEDAPRSRRGSHGGGPADIPHGGATSFRSGIDVTVLIHDVDDHGRYVVDAVVRSGLRTKVEYVQERLVAQGWAWAFQGFASKGPLLEAMDKAKAGRLGLWKDEKAPLAPWTFRRQQQRGGGGGQKHRGGDAGGSPKARRGGGGLFGGGAERSGAGEGGRRHSQQHGASPHRRGGG